MDTLNHNNMFMELKVDTALHNEGTKINNFYLS